MLQQNNNNNINNDNFLIKIYSENPFDTISLISIINVKQRLTSDTKLSIFIIVFYIADALYIFLFFPKFKHCICARIAKSSIPFMSRQVIFNILRHTVTLWIRSTASKEIEDKQEVTPMSTRTLTGSAPKQYDPPPFPPLLKSTNITKSRNYQYSQLNRQYRIFDSIRLLMGSHQFFL